MQWNPSIIKSLISINLWKCLTFQLPKIFKTLLIMKTHFIFYYRYGRCNTNWKKNLLVTHQVFHPISAAVGKVKIYWIWAKTFRWGETPLTAFCFLFQFLWNLRGLISKRLCWRLFTDQMDFYKQQNRGVWQICKKTTPLHWYKPSALHGKHQTLISKHALRRSQRMSRPERLRFFKMAGGRDQSDFERGFMFGPRVTEALVA